MKGVYGGNTIRHFMNAELNKMVLKSGGIPFLVLTAIFRVKGENIGQETVRSFRFLYF